MLDLLRLESLPSLRGCVRLELIPSLLGKACLDSFLPAPDWVQFDFAPPIQSFACFGSLVFALDLLYLGPSASTRDYCRSDFTPSPFGKSCTGFTLLVPDPVHFDFSMSLKSFIHLELILPLCGIANLDFSSFVLDYTQLGSLLLIRSRSHLDLAVLALDFAHLGSSLSLHSFS